MTAEARSPAYTYVRPSRKRWEALVAEEAERVGVSPVAVLLKARSDKARLARWRAWKRLVETGKYSKSGIAHVGGYDHTSVLHAMKRLPEIEAMAVAA